MTTKENDMQTPSNTLPYSQLSDGEVFIDSDLPFYLLKGTDLSGNKVGVVLGPLGGGSGGGSQIDYTPYQNKVVLSYPSAQLSL